MNLKQALKITLLIVILAEEIKSVKEKFLCYMNSKKCPNCNYRITKDANYCSICRYKFS